MSQCRLRFTSTLAFPVTLFTKVSQHFLLQTRRSSGGAKSTRRNSNQSPIEGGEKEGGQHALLEAQSGTIHDVGNPKRIGQFGLKGFCRTVCFGQ